MFNFSTNPSITWEDIKEDLKSSTPLDWDWDDVLRNENLTWENIKEAFSLTLPDGSSFPINSHILSSHPSITWEIVKEDLLSDFPKQWNFSELSSNPNITWENVKEANNMFPELSNQWDYRSLSDNKMSVWKDRFIRERQQARCAKIKEDLFRIVGQPVYVFKNTFSEAEKEERGITDELIAEAAKYPVSFKNPNFEAYIF
jgi:hypothetical protein